MEKVKNGMDLGVVNLSLCRVCWVGLCLAMGVAVWCLSPCESQGGLIGWGGGSVLGGSGFPWTLWG